MGVLGFELESQGFSDISSLTMDILAFRCGSLTDGGLALNLNPKVLRSYHVDCII